MTLEFEMISYLTLASLGIMLSGSQGYLQTDFLARFYATGIATKKMELY